MTKIEDKIKELLNNDFIKRLSRRVLALEMEPFEGRILAKVYLKDKGGTVVDIFKFYCDENGNVPFAQVYEKLAWLLEMRLERMPIR